jgi:hypothetical protein
MFSDGNAPSITCLCVRLLVIIILFTDLKSFQQSKVVIIIISMFVKLFYVTNLLIFLYIDRTLSFYSMDFIMILLKPYELLH